ncbi:hypothetical protein ACFQ3S_18975 [Mucilaginibacter terrae]|uniref:hypothetical protein n=1 Tax=Mucilaginibacter terrae TaxID=1955052 RepID=UPI00362F47EB
MDKNLPLPASFVLDHNLQVVFAFPNEYILSIIPVDRVAIAVYKANNYLAGKKTA